MFDLELNSAGIWTLIKQVLYESERGHIPSNGANKQRQRSTCFCFFIDGFESWSSGLSIKQRD